MEEERADALLVTALDETAWLLNLRGDDVKHTPVFLAYMFITKRRAIVCAQAQAFSEEIKGELKKAGITLLPYESIEELVASSRRGSGLWRMKTESATGFCASCQKGWRRSTNRVPSRS